MNAKFSYGREFFINDRIFYPAYLSLHDMKGLAEVLRNTFIREYDSYEITVSRILNAKGLEWEFKAFSLSGKLLYLNNIYTYHLYPDWTINGGHDNWYSGGTTARCQQYDAYEAHHKLDSDINYFLCSLENYYESRNVLPHKDRYLVKDGKHIVLMHDERGVRYKQLAPSFDDLYN
jgi:hypothetical protein